MMPTKLDMNASRVSSSESELSFLSSWAGGPGDPGAGRYNISGSSAFLLALMK